MKSSVKTNSLALISFISGLIALLSIGFIFAFYISGEAASRIINITDGIIMPVRNFSVAVALITGILALRSIKKKSGNEKGKIFAWIGIAIGTVWLFFGLFVGILFSLGEILH